jgi:hypothetical protein
VEERLTPTGGPPSACDSRVLIFSQRRLSSEVWHAAQFEFEDLLTEIDDAVVLAPEREDHQYLRGLSNRVANAALSRLHRPRRVPLWPSASMRVTPVGTEHDLFFGIFHNATELAYLHRLVGWRERSRRAVCLLVELWTPEIEAKQDYLELLRQFDAVYVFNPCIAQDLSRRLGIDTPGYLSMAVDALGMSPLPQLPRRVIDVYSYGRRSSVSHATLLDLVEANGLTYLYDTLTDAHVRDHREHRRLMANMMKRSRYFLTHKINDSPERRARTGGEEGLTTRYFEGAAGGAVMLGTRPDTPLFDEAFPWADAVVPLAFDVDGIAEVMYELDRQPDRVAQIRADNVRGSLSRHDWAHRWADVLRDAELAQSPAHEKRLEILAHCAEQVEPSLF